VPFTGSESSLPTERRPTTALVLTALRHDGHCVAHAPEALLLAPAALLGGCHLLISTMRVDGRLRLDLLEELRESPPSLPILYFRDPETDREATRASDVTVRPTPSTTGELQQAVRRSEFSSQRMRKPSGL
jgi:hypothetical protein